MSLKAIFENRLLRIFVSGEFLASSTVILIILFIRETLWLPIYPDEVADKIVFERYFLSGGFRQALIPACSDGFLIAPPLSLLPASTTWALADHLGTGLLSFRLLPIFALLLIIFVAIYRLTDYNTWPTVLILTFGPALYGLLIFRSEIFLLSAALLLYIGSVRFISKVHSLECISIMIFLLYALSLAFYMHPKALYIAPLAVSCIVLGAMQFKVHWRKALYLVIFGGGLIWITTDALSMHLRLFHSCDNIPSVGSFFKQQTVNAIDILYHRPIFFGSISRAFAVENLTKTIDLLIYKRNYDPGFLNGIPQGGWVYVANILIIFGLLSAFFYTITKISICYAYPFNRKVKSDCVLLFILFSVLLFIGLSKIHKAMYDCSFLSGSICLTTTLARPLRISPVFQRFSWANTSLSWLAGGLLVFTSALSLIINRQHFTSDFRNGYLGWPIDILSAQDWLAPQIPAIERRYAMGATQPIVIDDLTYDLFKQHSIVVPVTYLLFSLTPQVLADYHLRFGVFSCHYADDVKKFTKVLVLETIAMPRNVPSVCVVSF